MTAEKAKKSIGEITLIKYMWFDNELLLIHYLNNEPNELIAKEITKQANPIIETKSQNIKPHIANVSGGKLILNNKGKEVIAYASLMKDEQLSYLFRHNFKNYYLSFADEQDEYKIEH